MSQQNEEQAQFKALKIKLEKHSDYHKAWDLFAKLGYKSHNEKPYAAQYIYTYVDGTMAFDWWDAEGTDLSSPGSTYNTYLNHKNEAVTITQLEEMIEGGLAQEQNTKFAILDQIGNTSSLSVQHLVAIADNAISPEQEEQIRQGQEIDGIYSYPLGHYYTITPDLEAQDFDHERYFEAHIHFQDGPVPIEGINGITNEALLEILIHRTKILNDKFPCDENKRAITYMENALALFNQRTANRVARGVEGQNVV